MLPRRWTDVSRRRRRPVVPRSPAARDAERAAYGPLASVAFDACPEIGPTATGIVDTLRPYIRIIVPNTGRASTDVVMYFLSSTPIFM